MKSVTLIFSVNHRASRSVNPHDQADRRRAVTSLLHATDFTSLRSGASYSALFSGK